MHLQGRHEPYVDFDAFNIAMKDVSQNSLPPLLFIDWHLALPCKVLVMDLPSLDRDMGRAPISGRMLIGRRLE